MGYDQLCRSLLRVGDELCRSREISMPSTEEVKGIYKECKRLLKNNKFGDTPLIHASRLGFEDMVWGFIQYAKQTNTNLDTDETGEYQKFLGYKNRHGQTALDVAIEKDFFEVVKAFATALEDLSWQQLTDTNVDGKTLLSLLSNHAFDEIVFKAMKTAGKRNVDSISISVDEDNHQESIVYTEHMMHPNAPSLLSQYNRSTTLNKLDNGDLELDPNGNTIIHLLSQFGKGYDLQKILEKHPSLVYRRNHQKETPLFVASREGHLDILKLLINYVKVETDLEKLVTRSTDNYTALHIAIEKHHAPIVFWLVNRLPQLANCINVFNESPLYFAAQRGYRHILRLILDESKEKSFEGPNGKTALHAAVMSQESVEPFIGGKGFSKRESYRHTSNLECVKSLLQKKKDLLYIRDKTGWAPFHYAVYHDIGKATVEALLKTDPNIGSLDINHPTGRNILHVAVENKRMDTIKKLFGKKKLINLANQKDSNGDTPLHLFMASDIEIDEMRMDCGVNIYAVNNENLTTLDVASSYEKRHILIKAVKTGVWRTSPSHEEPTKFGDCFLVVTALIATISFAAAFTVPGGFDGNEGSKQGMPILLRKTAYKAFVVSNAVAFICSCCVLFVYMRLQIYLTMSKAANGMEEKEKEEKRMEEEEKEEKLMEEEKEKEKEKKRMEEEENEKEKKRMKEEYLIELEYGLTGIAIVAMASAFFTGTYVILAPSHAFAISLCAICVCYMVCWSFVPSGYYLLIIYSWSIKARYSTI